MTSQVAALRRCNATLAARPERLRQLPDEELFAYLQSCFAGKAMACAPGSLLAARPPCPHLATILGPTASDQPTAPPVSGIPVGPLSHVRDQLAELTSLSQSPVPSRDLR